VTRIARVLLLPYRLPLVRPWVTGRGRWNERCGMLLCLEDEAGLRGYGDCAPWSEFGTEDPEVSHHQLQRLARECRGRDLSDLLRESTQWRETPAARCTVESAVLDLESRRLGRPLADWLDPEADREVAVNAALGALNDGLPARAEAAMAAGYRVLKVKLDGEPGEALARLRELSSGLVPGASLRLDVNGMWDPETALRMVTALAALRVESVEEPLNVWDPFLLRQLQELAPFPVALDESLAGRDLEGFLEQCTVNRLVLKPMALGGMRRCLDVARRAYGEGREVVVTTTVDSGVGIRTALHLAAALPGVGVHGLATRDWLRADVGPAPPIRGGFMETGTAPGLGFEPFPAVAAALTEGYTRDDPWTPELER
jgi:o-succinylbenzoate synthase